MEVPKPGYQLILFLKIQHPKPPLQSYDSLGLEWDPGNRIFFLSSKFNGLLHTH